MTSTEIRQLIAGYWKQKEAPDFVPPAALVMAPATMQDVLAKLGEEGRFLMGLEPPVLELPVNEGAQPKLWGLPVVRDATVPPGEVRVRPMIAGS